MEILDRFRRGDIDPLVLEEAKEKYPREDLRKALKKGFGEIASRYVRESYADAGASFSEFDRYFDLVRKLECGEEIEYEGVKVPASPSKPG